MTSNIVKRLANQNCVNCLFDIISQSDMLRLFTEQRQMCAWGQRTIRNEEDKMLFSLGHSAESFVVSLLSDQLAQPEGTVNAS